MASLSENQYDAPTKTRPMPRPMTAPPLPKNEPISTSRPPSPASRTYVLSVFLLTFCLLADFRVHLFNALTTSDVPGRIPFSAAATEDDVAMDRRVRIGMGVVVGLVLLVAAFLIGRAVSGDDDGKDVAAGTTTSSVVGATSTVVGATSLAPVTTDAPAPVTTAVPSGTVVTSAGAFLEEAPQPTVHSTKGPDSDCALLVDVGWTVDKCDRVVMAGGERVWLTEFRPSGPFKEWQAVVLHWSQGKGAWLVDLQLGDQDEFAEVNVRAADLTADGPPELVFGFHLTGSGSILVYDIVVDGPGDLAIVGASRQLSHGRATVVPGLITDYEAKYPNGEPNCCPAYIQVSEVTYSAGAFRVVETVQNDPGTGPPADPADI